MAVNKELDAYKRGLKPFLKDGVKETMKTLRLRKSFGDESKPTAQNKLQNAICSFQALSMVSMMGAFGMGAIDIVTALDTQHDAIALNAPAIETPYTENGIVTHGEDIIALRQNNEFYIFTRDKTSQQFTLVSAPEDALSLINQNIEDYKSWLLIDQLEQQHQIDLSDNDTSYSIEYGEISAIYSLDYAPEGADPVHVYLSPPQISPEVMDADELMQQLNQWTYIKSAMEISGYDAGTITVQNYEMPERSQITIVEDAAYSAGAFLFLSMVFGFGLAGARQTGYVKPAHPTPVHKRLRRKDNPHVG